MLAPCFVYIEDLRRWGASGVCKVSWWVVHELAQVGKWKKRYFGYFGKWMKKVFWQPDKGRAGIEILSTGPQLIFLRKFKRRTGIGKLDTGPRLQNLSSFNCRTGIKKGYTGPQLNFSILLILSLFFFLSSFNFFQPSFCYFFCTLILITWRISSKLTYFIQQFTFATHISNINCLIGNK